MLDIRQRIENMNRVLEALEETQLKGTMCIDGRDIVQKSTGHIHCRYSLGSDKWWNHYTSAYEDLGIEPSDVFYTLGTKGYTTDEFIGNIIKPWNIEDVKKEVVNRYDWLELDEYGKIRTKNPNTNGVRTVLLNGFDKVFSHFEEACPNGFLARDFKLTEESEDLLWDYLKHLNKNFEVKELTIEEIGDKLGYKVKVVEGE